MTPGPQRILITAAGSTAAVSLIRHLRRTASPDDLVVAVDASEYAAGLYLADRWELVPPANDSHYVPRLLEVCRHYSLSMVIPVLDIEAFEVARRRVDFRSKGIVAAVNTLNCLQDAHDKVRSFEVCRVAGISQPERFAEPGEAPPEAFPLIGKPVLGGASRGLIVLPDAGAPLPPALHPSAMIWQQFIRGREYSIDTFGAADASCFVAVPRFRRKIRDGQMVQGQTVDDPALVEFARRVCAAFHVDDVACIQVIRDDQGDLYFIEINPRYGAGVALSLAAGVNFPRLQWLSHFAPEAITPEMTPFRPGLEMLRYWDAVFR